MSKIWTGRRIEDLYRRGVILLREATSLVIRLAGKEGAEVATSGLGKEVVCNVRAELEKAPTDDAGWEPLLFIQGGTYSGEYDQADLSEIMKAEHRAGVEALRDYFAKNPDSI